MYDRFSGFIKFWSSERNTENTTPHLYFNEESDYACDNGVFRSTILHHKKIKHNDASAADLLHIVLEYWY